MKMNLVSLEVRELWWLAWPIFLAHIASVGAAAADVAMSGHVSSRDLAGVAIGDAMFLIVGFTLIGIFLAVNTIISQYVGSQKKTLIGPFVKQSLWAALFVGIAGGIFCAFIGYCLKFLSGDPYVINIAQQFLFIISFAIPAVCIYRVLHGYSTSIGNTKPMMFVAIGGFCCQVILNWIFIFGNFGMPHLGGVGCAVSTLISSWIKVVVMILWINRNIIYRISNPFSEFVWPEWNVISNMLKIGWPIGIAFLVEGAAFSIIAILIVPLNATEIAAHQITFNLSAMALMIPMSIGVAITTRVGEAVGAKNSALAHWRAYVGIGSAIVVSACCGVFLACFRFDLANLYSSDPVTVSIATNLILLLAIYQIFEAIQSCSSAAIRAFSETMLPMYVQVISFWVFAIPIGYILGIAPSWFPLSPEKSMGSSGFWIGLSLGLFAASIGLSFVLKRVLQKFCNDLVVKLSF